MARKLALAACSLLLLAVMVGGHGRVMPLPPAPSQPVSPIAQDLPAGPVGAVSPARQNPAWENGPRVSPSARLPLASLVKIKELEPAVQKYARAHGVDEDLVWAVMRHESGFNPRAVSPKGAMGLMQLMPGTASLMGVTDPFDLEENIAGGIKYLEQCLSRFNQDIALALAAYNAGPQNVAKYNGCPPFPETRQYVAAVLQTYSGHPQYRRLGLGGSVSDEVAALLDMVGLHWRVSRPQWKIAEPQFLVRSPQWKGARAHLVTLAR